MHWKRALSVEHRVLNELFKIFRFQKDPENSTNNSTSFIILMPIVLRRIRFHAVRASSSPFSSQ